MNGNYIKLDRSILDWEWYKNENTFCVFLHCLLKANWKDGRFEGVEVPRGSFVTSISKLSEELELSYQSVRTALNHLKSTGELTVTPHSKFSVVTVNNYDVYQSSTGKSTGKQQATNRQLTGNQQATNNNRRKEEGKKESKEEGKNKYYPNDSKLDEAFRDYVEMRKFIKSPMTDRAVTMAMNKLEELTKNKVTGAMDNDLAIKIIEESIVNNWKSFYPLKNNNRKSTSWEDA